MERRERIRRGCVLLEDAFKGRGKYGLFSLLDAPVWRQAVFLLYSNKWWEYAVLVACFCHSLTIFWESPGLQGLSDPFPLLTANHLTSWNFQHLDSLMVMRVEFACIVIYTMDISMKIIWSSHCGLKPGERGWHYIHTLIVVLFIVRPLDYYLFINQICGLRFSRPFRLVYITSKLPEVRFLASFLPVMCVKLATSFSGPWIGFLSIFGAICVRLYGALPEDQQLDLEGDSTLDNFDPVVVQVFITFVGFYLMSMDTMKLFAQLENLKREEEREGSEERSRGKRKNVQAQAQAQTQAQDQEQKQEHEQERGQGQGLEVGDLYGEESDKDLTAQKEERDKTIEAQAREVGELKPARTVLVEVQLLQPLQNFPPYGLDPEEAFQLLDVNNEGKIGWKEYVDMMHYLRPYDSNPRHLKIIFTNACKTESNFITINDLQYLQSLRRAKFVKSVSKVGTRKVDFLAWDAMNFKMILADSILLCCGLDSVALFQSQLELGTCMLAASVLHLQYLAIVDFNFLKEVLVEEWRMIDCFVLVFCALAQALYCVAIAESWSVPWPQLLSAAAAVRSLRVALYHAPSRRYLIVFCTQVGPLLLDFAALVASTVFAFCCIGMELLAHPTHQCSPPVTSELNVTSTSEDLPNFNTASSGLFSTFLLFVEDWNGLVHIADKSGSPVKIAFVSGGQEAWRRWRWQMLKKGQKEQSVYENEDKGKDKDLKELVEAVALKRVQVVEFMQVWQAEDIKARKKALLNKFKGAAHVIMAKNRLRRMMSFGKGQKKQEQAAAGPPKSTTTSLPSSSMLSSSMLSSSSPSTLRVILILLNPPVLPSSRPPVLPSSRSPVLLALFPRPSSSSTSQVLPSPGPPKLERFDTSREMLQQARELVSEQLEYMVVPVDGSWRTRLWLHSKEEED
ncbi:hypothetical protein GUITHDRAFT_138395 [Guillardia theta CCMP2712]|uniref:EF-hand domain-containing protein n=1 Tax=Guillardia theta (strain CCMP2712) TaxID=905079 RepID=L1JDF2_GUITC|nr:hypothetical protein GUITHDRAFT_138395 [Guillardia theta CCMP2712]EKX46302.1 hypothetical protein GUITHDRAFT_138395 [Guillardia theta CCMP2712]|eukprot:XP_005833282.1 hypothetical protein GUITHDRAFT_138395 [Guillardia theta CCMP2712]